MSKRTGRGDLASVDLTGPKPGAAQQSANRELVGRQRVRSARFVEW